MNQKRATESRVARIRWGYVSVAAAAVLLASAALGIAATRSPAGAASPPSCGGSSPRLTVQGTGEASGSPDALDFGAQVKVTASSAQAALATDNATTGAVVQAIEGAGVKTKDVQTADLTINPNYGYVHGQSVITGYDVSNSLSITVRKLESAGSVLDAATAAGGDALSISSLNFARSDPRILEDRARTDAVRQAVTHAAAMARASGQRLGSVCSLTDESSLDQGGQSSPEFAPSLADTSGAVPVEPGTQQASAQVTLVYDLEPLAR